MVHFVVIIRVEGALVHRLVNVDGLAMVAHAGDVPVVSVSVRLDTGRVVVLLVGNVSAARAVRVWLLPVVVHLDGGVVNVYLRGVVLHLAV